MKIHKNDKVKILTGKDKGKTGKVVQVLKSDEKLVVDGINLMKKNIKSNKEGQKGQIIELPAPIRVSNVKLICEKCNTATRVGYQILAGKDKSDKSKKVRICKKCKEVLN